MIVAGVQKLIADKGNGPEKFILMDYVNLLIASSLATQNKDLYALLVHSFRGCF